MNPTYDFSGIGNSVKPQYNFSGSSVPAVSDLPSLSSNNFSLSNSTPSSIPHDVNKPFANTPLGIGLNTVKELAGYGAPQNNPYVQTAKDVSQGITRSIGSVGLTLAGPFGGGSELDASDIKNTTAQKVFSYVFGDHPLKDLQTRIAENEIAIKQSSFAQKIGLSKGALPLAFGGVMGDAVLNLTMFGGGEEGVIKTLTAESNPAKIATILDHLKVPADIAEKFAPEFAKATDSKEVADLFKTMKGLVGSKYISGLSPNAIADMAQETPTPPAYDYINMPANEKAAAMADMKANTPSNPLQETVKQILDGDIKIGTGPDLKTEKLSILGRGRYASIFRNDPSLDTLDVIAHNAGVSSDELLQAIVDEAEVRKLPASTLAMRGIASVPARTASEIDTTGLSALHQGPEETVPPELAKGLAYDIKDIPVKNRVNALDYLRTPEYVLEKIGLGEEAKTLRGAFDSYKAQLPKEIERITGWYHEVQSIPYAREDIFKYLDGKQAIKLSPVEDRVAQEIKAYLKDWAEKLGLPPEKQISRYITHIFEKDFLAKEFDPEMAKLIDSKVAGSVFDPFLQRRVNMPGYKEDVFAALDAYVKRGVRKFNMDPALKGLQDASKRLDLESYKYVQKLAARVNLRPTEVDNLFDNLFKTMFGYKLGPRPTAYVSQKIRQIFYRGSIGLNISSAIRNLTQGVNTYARLGERYTITGYTKFLTNMMSPGGLEELTRVGVLGEDLVQDRALGVYKEALHKIDDSLFGAFEMAEKINRGAAYFGAKAKALNQGLGETQAINYAKRMVRETQFAFGSIDTPVALSSDIIKTLAQLQTYNVKQMEFLGGMIAKKDWPGVIRYTAATFVMLSTIGKLFGMSINDIIPTVRFGGSPLVGGIQGAIGYATAGNAQQKATAKNQLINTGAMMIPGGGQMKKAVQGYQTVSQGKSTTPTGKTRYTVPKNTENYIRAMLFGPSNLPQAQNYYNNVGKPKANAIQYNF